MSTGFVLLPVNLSLMAPASDMWLRTPTQARGMQPADWKKDPICLDVAGQAAALGGPERHEKVHVQGCKAAKQVLS